MARLFNYLKEDWVTRRWYENLLAAVLAPSMIIQCINIANADSGTTVAISAICFYLNSIVIISTMLNPIRYMPPMGSLLNTYGVIKGYLPFKTRQGVLIDELCRLMEAAGFAMKRKQYLGFPLDLLQMQIEFIVMAEKMKSKLVDKAPV